MTKQGLNELRLEIEVPTDGLPNLIPNPSGESGAWGYISPVNNTIVQAYTSGLGPYLLFQTNAQQAAYFTSEFLPIAGSMYVSSRYDLAGYNTDTSNMKAKYEFYDLNKVLISTTAQGSATGTLTGTYYGPTFQAPANAAYVKIRWDLYTSATTPNAGTYVNLRKIMVTTSATGTPTTSRRNLYPNPSFEVDTAAVLPNNYTAIARSAAVGGFSGTSALRMTGLSGESPQAVFGVVSSANGAANVPVTPGKTYTFSFYSRASGTGRRLQLTAVSNTGNSFGSKTFGSNAGGTWTRFSYTFTAPSNVTKVCFLISVYTAPGNEAHYIDGLLLEEGNVPDTYFDGSSSDTTSLDYAWTGTAHNSASTVTNIGAATFGYTDPNDWQDILGPTTEIAINRQALDVGTMSAVVMDAVLDPAVADTIRPGKKIRLRSLVGTAWESLFDGVLTSATTTYEKEKKVNGEVKVRVDITATDNIATLANQDEIRGVQNIMDLPWVLEGKGVPWNVNGSGNQVNSAAVVSMNDNASVLDQIAVTRDSALGYAWVDRNNILQAWDKTQMPSAALATFSDAASTDPTWLSYTDIDVSFSTETCINTVNVQWLRYKAADKSTEEIPYGPYTDAVSIKTWGARSATFTIHGGSESASSIAAYAQSILAANATPKIRANSLVMPVRNDKERKYATTLDLYSPVAVKYDNKVDTTLRVTGIEHRITPNDWLVTYAFDVATSVASPTWIPSPSGTPGDTIVDGVWYAPTLTNGWLNYGSGWANAGYMRRNGVVYLRGLVKSGTNGVPIFTLPAGCRPEMNGIFAGMTNTKTSTAKTYTTTVPNNSTTSHRHDVTIDNLPLPNTAARIDILTTGAVEKTDPDAANGWISLDGISFVAGA